MLQIQSPETSSGENGLNISKCKSQIGQDQMSGRVSVLCWLVAPVAILIENPKFGNKIKVGNKVQFGNKGTNW